MKKILLFSAALLTAFQLNAAITSMTCAQAKQYTLDNIQSGETGTDSVAVTGYVTSTNGTVSPSRDGKNTPQQVFWLDDEKGSTQTFQAYWCNLPSNEALNVGDKVTIRGFLMNYNGTAEMKNGDTEIIERVVIKRDTIESTVCDVIAEGEALNDKEVTTDYFIVEGVVANVVKPLNQYKQETFTMLCGDNQKELKAYQIMVPDSVAAEVGDKVEVLGRIQKYGTAVNLISGTAKVLEKGEAKIDTIRVSVAEAVAAGKNLEKGKTSVEVYIVTGYNDSIAYKFNPTKKNMTFFMCDDMTNPTYDFEAYKVSTEQDIPVGTKVSVVGKLFRYYKEAKGDKPEIDLIEISEGEVYVESTEAVENIFSGEKAVKRIENGQVVIIRNGVRFNALGTQITE